MFKIEMIFIFTSSSDTLFHSLKGHSRSPARGWRLSSYLSRIAMRCGVLTESDKALIIYSPEQRILDTLPPTELVCNVLCVGTWLSSDIQRGSEYLIYLKITVLQNMHIPRYFRAFNQTKPGSAYH